MGTKSTTFQMYLNDRKVIGFFGPNPERGKVFPITVNREAGMRWNEFKKCWQPNPIQVNHIVVARCVKRGLWEVTCAKSIAQTMTELLHRRCAAV